MLHTSNLSELLKFHIIFFYKILKYQSTHNYVFEIENFYLYLKFFEFSSFYFKTDIFFFKPKIRKLMWRIPKKLRYNNFNSFKKFSSSALLRKFFLLLKKKRYRLLKKNRYLYGFLELRKKFCKIKVNVLKMQLLHHKFFKKTKQSVFLLTQRIFLTEKHLKSSLWFYLHKLRKLKSQAPHKINHTKNYNIEEAEEKDESNLPVIMKKKIYYLNLHRPIIKKLRNARYCHWNLRTYGRLNEYRYHKLLAFELRQTAFLARYSLLSLGFFSSFVLLFSWKQLLLILNYNLIFINGKPFTYITPSFGDIIELPSKFGLKNFIKKKIKSNRVIISRANRLAYKAYLRNSKRNTNIKKYEKVPRLFKRLQTLNLNLQQNFLIDVATNTFVVKNLDNIVKINLESKLINKSVLSLQNWRYRFD